ENEPEINKSYFSSNYLNRLQIYFDNENKEKFYSESKKCIREYRNWLVTGKRDKSFELTTLDEKIASGEISEELIESLKLLERSSDNYLYGGIEEDGEGQAFLNKLRIALHL
ncbi:MAG: hypothetical protein KJ941_08515, partial [Bacteroidetes bacterium]|nr:hypothetical protein [Bacteroidota bacterium]